MNSGIEENATVVSHPTIGWGNPYKFTLEDIESKKQLSIKISREDIIGAFNYFNSFHSYESCYRTLVKNLFKKNRFVELENELLQEEIREEDLDNIIKTHPEKYVIELRSSINQNERNCILNITHNLKDDFDELTFNEVAQLFSVNPTALLDN